MSEVSSALGIPSAVSEVLELAARELSFGAAERARELCDHAIERTSPSSPQLGAALYLKGLASEGESRRESLREAVAVLVSSADPRVEAEARLALAEALVFSDTGDARAELDRAASTFAERRDVFGTARVTLVLARAALVDQRRDEARELARSAISMFERMETSDARRAEVRARELLGDASVDPSEALDSYRDALALSERAKLADPVALREKIERLRARRGPFR